MKVSIPQTPAAAYEHARAIEAARLRTVADPTAERVGRVRVETHRDYPEHHIVIWQPVREDLWPVDLTEFSADDGGLQTAHYSVPAYADHRRRFEDLLTAARGAGLATWLYNKPDRANVGECELTIVVDARARERTTVRLELLDAMPLVVAPGAAAAETQTINVSALSDAEFVALIKRIQRRGT